MSIENECENCRYYDKREWEDPCRDCVNSKTSKWEPAEEKQTKADSGQQGESFQEFLKRRMLEKENRPKPLPGAVPYYKRESSRIPEQIRISFSDGSTAVYELHVNQPAPQIVESIKIIRRMKQGYVNQPARRRRNRR